MRDGEKRGVGGGGRGLYEKMLISNWPLSKFTTLQVSGILPPRARTVPESVNEAWSVTFPATSLRPFYKFAINKIGFITPSLISLMVSVDVKHHVYLLNWFHQSPGAVWKSRWPSWAPVPNKPLVSVDVKQHFNFTGFIICQPVWPSGKALVLALWFLWT